LTDKPNPLPEATAITCENGHYIARTVKALDIASPVDGRELTAWAKGMKHETGDAIRPCRLCGADWLAFKVMGPYWLHTAEYGWWPDDKPLERPR